MNRTELLQELAARIDRLRLDHPSRVAIDGVDAAGKTVLADELAPLLTALGRQVIRASIDGFHNPAAVRRGRGALSPEGYYLDSFDHAALVAALLEPLGPGGDRVCRRAVFDFRTDAAVESEPIEAAADAVLLFDGVFLLRPALRDYWDFSVFVRADFDVTVARAEQRDLYPFGDSGQVRERYEQRYVPGQRLYFADANPESRATVVVDNNHVEAPVLVPPTKQAHPAARAPGRVCSAGTASEARFC